MEMMVNLFGFGAAIPKTGFGLNIASASYIGFRYSVSTPATMLGVSDIVSMGSKSGTFIGSWIATDWFYVDLAKHGWVADANRLIGKKAQIEVSGTLVVHGTVDLKFTTFDKGGDTNELLSKVDIKASGGQLSETKVRGVLKQILRKGNTQ